MKIKIGPYINYYSAYDFFSFLTRFGVTEEKIEKLCDGVFGKILEKLFKFIYSKQSRKVKIHIDKYDAWNGDHTLALIIVPLLQEIAETKQGAPHVDDEDVPEELRESNSKIPFSKEKGEVDEFFFKRWDYVLNEMIWAFNQIVDDRSEDQFYIYKEDFGNELTADNHEEFFMKNFDVDLDGLKQFNKRIDNGLRLFGKYYRALWT